MKFLTFALIIITQLIVIQSCNNIQKTNNIKEDNDKRVNNDSNKIKNKIDNESDSISLDGIPKSGTYIYSVEFAEWEGKITKDAVTVIINNDRIKVINNGILSGEKGEVIQEGYIMKHKSGKWIIGIDKNDINIDEVGGCTDGPMIINFEKKLVELC